MFVVLLVGIGMSLVVVVIVILYMFFDFYDGWGIVCGLLMLGNLLVCFGYVGFVVMLLYSCGWLLCIVVLVFMGCMVFINYLM